MIVSSPNARRRQSQGERIDSALAVFISALQVAFKSAVQQKTRSALARTGLSPH